MNKNMFLLHVIFEQRRTEQIGSALLGIKHGEELLSREMTDKN